MKKFIINLLIFSVGIPYMNSAQVSPQFQTAIVVTDAIGNIDSVIVGHDTLATYDIDIQFGEFEILTPFDSVLEVRASTMSWPEREKTSKIIIEKAGLIYPVPNNHGCYSSAPIFIYIWAKYQPVTISWDSARFLTNICHNGSLLSNHWADEVTDPYDWDAYPQNKNYCMAAQNSFIIDISEDAVLAEGITMPVQISKEVQGLGQQNIYGVRFYHAPAFTGYTPPCYYLTNKTDDLNKSRKIDVFPNPTPDKIFFQLPQGVYIDSILLMDISGRQVFYNTNNNVTSLDLTGYSPGVYFLQIKGSDGNNYTGKLIKI